METLGVFFTPVWGLHRVCANTKATIITSQLPIEHWHEWIGDATIADAMLDRLMQNNHRFTLTGESMRKKSTPKAKTSTVATNPESA